MVRILRWSLACSDRPFPELGVDEKTAAADACEMEHAVSPESYEAPNGWQIPGAREKARTVRLEKALPVKC